MSENGTEHPLLHKNLGVTQFVSRACGRPRKRLRQKIFEGARNKVGTGVKKSPGCHARERPEALVASHTRLEALSANDRIFFYNLSMPNDNRACRKLR